MKKIPKLLSNRFEPQFIEVGEQIYNKGAYRNFDFVRNSFCAQFIDNRGEYWAYIKKKKDKDNFAFSCDCNTFMRHMECQHIPALLFVVFSQDENPETIYDNISQKYYSTIWEILAKESFELYQNAKVKFESNLDLSNKTLEITCKNSDDKTIFKFNVLTASLGKLWRKYRSILFRENEQAIKQFIQSMNELSHDGRDILQPEKTELEERMNLAGYKSWRQKFEESFWFDFSKIWYLTINEDLLTVDYDQKNQSLAITSPDPRFTFYVQKNQLAAILKMLSKKPALKKVISFSDQKLFLNYSLEITDNFELKITPILKVTGQEKPIILDKDNQYEVAVFGKYLYLKSLGFFPFEREISYFDSSIFHFKEVIIRNQDIPNLIREYRKSINENQFYHVSPSLMSENFVSKIDSAKVTVADIRDDWCYLDVKYKVNDETLSFGAIYHAIQQNKRYLIGKHSWIDLQLPQLDWIYELTPEQIEESSNHRILAKLSKLHFLKMRSLLPKKNKIISNNEHKIDIEKLLSYKSRTDAPSLEKNRYVLRDYQKNGHGWLWFLYENGLSGLLCDDMGLGKTYQSLALMDSITMTQDRACFLVVCPTSVIPHWRDKLTQFKKKVNLHIYYGADRKLKNISKNKYSVILTSYGIMRNDLEILEKIPFDVMIFDEIQSAKNKASLTNAALTQLKGRIKIGLTGTPIENDLFELKALFDIILPGYLGRDINFKKKYIEPIENKSDEKALEQLHRLLNPFTLRRTKSQVLEELPPKTEEIRKCELSVDQIKLYKDVINNRAQGIVRQLFNKNEKIPYMHIFAVLNYLKQICNHPAQLENNGMDYRLYQSGKWDLFCELLEESLNSGFKVVVYSQFLNMLALIEMYLKEIGVEFATIKGSTKNRGEMIDRFNNDPECMVFTGSLKASGLGINLIGGSVVIHYDRWWNAAREDQATDRVHRIGQTRGVQVFKLITEGTLEEKIDRLINKKKNLMENLVQIDDASVIKSFDRNELVDLLTFKSL